MSTTAKNRARRTAVALGSTALIAGVGAVMAAFTATTANPGNSISTGTVAISDNDGANVPMYTAASDGNLKPGETKQKCIVVTYGGSLASSVKLYAAAAITNADQFTLLVERDNTPDATPFPGCGTFAPDSTVFNAALNTFPTSYATGLDGKASGAAWLTNDAVAYRFTLATLDETTANARTTPITTSTHEYRWEARNN